MYIQASIVTSYRIRNEKLSVDNSIAISFYKKQSL